jgi:hypothetical protein
MKPRTPTVRHNTAELDRTYRDRCAEAASLYVPGLRSAVWVAACEAANAAWVALREARV